MASTTPVDARAFPEILPSGFLEKFQKLSINQAGHLRHFHNLANQPDGEWSHMGAEVPGQESDESYRYQLAHMAYATGAAHYHRLPALRSVFKRLLEQLIHKMLHREVWGYWYLTSQAGTLSFPEMKELREPCPDPVRKENIMYAGHLFLMVSLHGMLFDDDKYDKPDAIVFNWNPLFFGLGPETFYYSRSSLQENILNQMEQSGWMGVCCEPNMVFIICNQFPLIGIRYNDVRNGTNVIQGVLEKYTEAWKKKGGFVNTDAGQFHGWWQPQEDILITPQEICITAWASTVMHSWNSEFVESIYKPASLGYFRRLPDGQISLNDPFVANNIRMLAAKEKADPDGPETFAKAFEMAKETGLEPNGVWQFSTFGLVSMWTSEVAREDSEGLVRYADQSLNPTWERGGLYYPRRDGPYVDEDGYWARMDPFTGNAGIAYARLNVQDGQKKMWEKPWSKEHFSSYPYVDGVDLSSVDFLRGSWENDLGAMAVTVRTWDESEKRIELDFQNLPVGKYGCYQGGRLVRIYLVRSRGDGIIIPVQVGPKELDIVLILQK